MPNSTDINISYVLTYCKEETAAKGKGADPKKTLAAPTVEQLENGEYCMRGHLMEEVVDQSILNVLSRGYKGGDSDRSMSYARCRIEEVSKNHQSNFFRIRMEVRRAKDRSD